MPHFAASSTSQTGAWKHANLMQRSILALRFKLFKSKAIPGRAHYAVTGLLLLARIPSYVNMYIYIYVCMYVCMCVYRYIYIYIYIYLFIRSYGDYEGVVLPIISAPTIIITSEHCVSPTASA